MRCCTCRTSGISGEEVAEGGQAGGAGQQAEVAAAGDLHAAIVPATARASLGLRERLRDAGTVAPCCGCVSAGGLRLEAGGVALPPPASRRARGVLAYLALHPGPHARAQLAARFWPDVLDESARTSLRAALSELRRALGPAAEHIVATRDTVALDGAGLDVDARRFDAGARAAAIPAAALAACPAPILDGFDEDWAHEARQAHAERLAEALELLAAATRRPGRGGPPDPRAGRARPARRGRQPAPDRAPGAGGRPGGGARRRRALRRAAAHDARDRAVARDPRAAGGAAAPAGRARPRPAAGAHPRARDRVRRARGELERLRRAWADVALLAAAGSC